MEETRCGGLKMRPRGRRQTKLDTKSALPIVELVLPNSVAMSQNNARSRSRLLSLVLSGICVMACCAARAGERFQWSEISGSGSNLLTADLNGDGLKDLVIMDDTHLSVFYQDANQTFTREPQLAYQLERRASVIWTARLGRKAESLLVMTGDGVSELDFSNRTSAPGLRQIIRQRTILPDAAGETNVMCLPMSAGTGSDWPLVLVPVAGGLQVWRHDDEWRRVQFISHTLEASESPLLPNPGYGVAQGVDLSIGDVNGDGRDDLMVCRGNGSQTVTYRLYLQQTNGLFGVEKTREGGREPLSPALSPLGGERETEPTMIYEWKALAHSWLYWADLNRDGHVDLIRSVWLNEPSFVPGLPSGKVVVSAYFADERGRIPAEPQLVLRKSDWMPTLPVVDLDGDGLPDLVLGYSQLDSREGVRKELTTRQLDYSLRFFFQRPGSGFPKEADCQRDLVLHMDQTEYPLSFTLSRYFERCVRFDGDFNGDGKKDLAVREHADAISIYFFLSREKGFSLKPDLKFNCPKEIDGWMAEDLNGDGTSDLIVKVGKEKGYQIYISQK
jgi:hypothetical protein